MYSVFNRSSVKSKIFCIYYYYTIFYTIFSDTSAVSRVSYLHQDVSDIFKNCEFYMNLFGVICKKNQFCNIGVMIPHLVKGAAHLLVLWPTICYSRQFSIGMQIYFVQFRIYLLTHLTRHICNCKLPHSSFVFL